MYNVQCPPSPVVLPLGERGGAGHLGPGLPLPGHEGHRPASHEHERADKIPNWLKQIKVLLSIKNVSEPHLEDALLNELSAIDNIADNEDEADDQVGHQGGVAEVLRVDVGVGVAELQRGGGEVEVVAVVSVSKINHLS